MPSPLGKVSTKSTDEVVYTETPCVLVAIPQSLISFVTAPFTQGSLGLCDCFGACRIGSFPFKPANQHRRGGHRPPAVCNANLRLRQNRKEKYFPSLCKGGCQRENADGRVGYNKQSFCISPFSSRQSLLSLCADPAFCLLTARAAWAPTFSRRESRQRFA